MVDSVAPALLAWYDVHARALPWRLAPSASGCADPYRVWLSEVMLQQTTTAAVAPYFERFTSRWPTVEQLAQAPSAEVMAEWAGLGYYSRARNLIACAREIVRRGAFPDNEADLRALPGIGPYTAAAIAAIAFGRRAVVIDANVERVVARLFAIVEPLPAARRAIRDAADKITPEHRPGDFAQAMMDLGAGICTSREPRCDLCPLAEKCLARAGGCQNGLPVKPPRRAKPQRKGNAYWIERDGRVLLITRANKGMLGGMRALPDDGWNVASHGSGHLPFAGEWQAMGAVQHVFTHFSLTLNVLCCALEGQGGPEGDLEDDLSGDLPEGEWVLLEKLPEAGLPTLFMKAVRRVLAMRGGSDDAAAKHQADDGNDKDDQAEIAPGVGS